MILRVRKYEAEGFLQHNDGAGQNVIPYNTSGNYDSTKVTFVEVIIVPDNPEDNTEIVVGRAFFTDELLDRFCSVITLEMEEDYVGRTN